MVTGVLLIPAEGHEDLIAEGPCGARVPMAYRYWREESGWSEEWLPCVDGDGIQDPPHCALAIAWEGKAHRSVILALWDRYDRDRTPYHDDMIEAVRAGELAEALGWGTLVVLDTE